MNDADNLKNHRGSLCPGPDPHCGGAYVPVLRGGGCVHCGLCGPVPAGDPLPAGRADSRLHRHVCAGVPGFTLWAPGPGRLAGGASAWCEVCGDGLYGKLILMDKVSRGAGRRVKQTAARFFCWERRCGYRYNLHPALQGSGGKNGCSDNGGSVCLRAQSEKDRSCVCLPL